MIRTLKLACVALALLAAGCESTPQPGSGAVAGKAGAGAPPAATGQFPREDRSFWTTDDQSNLVHRLSGAICAPAWAGLPRERIFLYRADGSDVSCNYTISSSPSYMTFYVFKGDLQEQLEGALEAMRTRQPAAREVPFGLPTNGYRARTLQYSANGGVTVRTSVLFAEADGWLLEIRLTTPERDAPRLEQAAGIMLMGQAERLRDQTRPGRRT